MTMCTLYPALKNSKASDRVKIEGGKFTDTRANSSYHSVLKSKRPRDFPRSKEATNFLVFGNLSSMLFYVL